MITFNSIKKNIVYEDKNLNLSSYNEDENLKGTSINLLSRNYEFINNFLNDDLFNLKLCKGYYLSKNIYELYTENKEYNLYFKKILYNNRYISDTPLRKMLKDAKDTHKEIIKLVSLDDTNNFPNGISFINNMGLHIETFMNEFQNINKLSIQKRIELFENFLFTYIKSQNNKDYKNLLIIPIESWIKTNTQLNYKIDINPISLLLYYIKTKKTTNNFGVDNILIYNRDKFFICDLNETLEKSDMRFKINISKLTGDYLNLNDNEKELNLVTNDKEDGMDSDDEIESENEDNIISVNDNIGFDDDIVDYMSMETISQLDYKEEEFTKKQLEFLENNEKYINSLKFNNKKLVDIVENKNDKPIPKISLNIDSPNQLWKNLTYVNTEKSYDLDADIVKIFHFFGNINKHNLILTDLKVEDTSTPQDYKYTWTASFRCFKNANKFDIKIDIPKMVDDKFMYLGGNNKYLGKQLFRIPISKSDISEVQLVSNYNKIFSRINKEYLNNKSSSRVYKLCKILLNNNLKNIKIIKGNNNRINIKYDMDLERYDAGSVISQIHYKDMNIVFDMDKIKENHKNIIGYYDNSKKIMVENNDQFGTILNILMEDEEFKNLYENTKDSTNYVYSDITILSSKFPIIYILCFHLGLDNALRLAKINYEIVEKKSKNDIQYAYIKLKDFYIKYENTVRNSLLICGLKDCGVEMFEYSELNKRNSWIDMLEILNIQRIKADGIDNFYDLYIDPITKEACEHYKIPDKYLELLVKASDMLLETGFLEHSEVSLYRLRSNEQIAGYLYNVLSEEYARFILSLKKTKKGKMFVKQSSVIDLIMKDKMFSDTSDINDLNMMESSQQVSYKGYRGMNTERAFNLEKRSYSESMNGIITGSTGFAGNVGMDRQISLNAKIKSTRGYLDEVEITKSKDLSLGDLSTTDSMIAMTTSSDDPFRQLMGYLQRNKHFVPTEVSDPPLITTGSDSALPYLTKNLFSIVSKYDGFIEELNDEYMLISYNNGQKDIINMKSHSIKDSAGGMYLELKYITNFKKGSKFKAGEIIAWDKKSYSHNKTEEISYNFGTLVKVGILNTDESYEDSCRVSYDLSEKMSSVIMKLHDVTLNKNCVLYHAAKVGTYIKDGEPLIIYQNPFDDNETNELLSKLNINKDDIDDDSEINDLGKIVVKSKVTGLITEVRVYRTVDKEEMSPTILKYYNSFSKPYEDKLKIVNKNNIKNKINEFSFTEKQDPVGKLKNANDSVVFEYHIRTTNKFSTGDKLVLYTANKGVEHNFFPLGLEPTSEFRPDEKVHIFGSLSAINKRKVTSVTKVALINKSIIELTRKVKDILGINYDINSDI